MMCSPNITKPILITLKESFMSLSLENKRTSRRDNFLQVWKPRTTTVFKLPQMWMWNSSVLAPPSLWRCNTNRTAGRRGADLCISSCLKPQRHSWPKSWETSTARWGARLLRSVPAGCRRGNVRSLCQVKYKEEGKKELGKNLYSALPETAETQFAKHMSEIQSEVRNLVDHHVKIRPSFTIMNITTHFPKSMHS